MSGFPTTAEGKLAYAQELKAQGNQFFMAGELKKAAKQYRTVFAFVNGLVSPNDDMAKYNSAGSDELTLTAEQGMESTALKVSCYSNLAAVHLKLGMPEKAAGYCESALKIEPNNVKAMFRLGQAMLEWNKGEEALRVLVATAKLDPQNKAVRVKIDAAKMLRDAQKAEASDKQKELFKGAF